MRVVRAGHGSTRRVVSAYYLQISLGAEQKLFETIRSGRGRQDHRDA
jgi:hypothetical protein